MFSPSETFTGPSSLSYGVSESILRNLRSLHLCQQFGIPDDGFLHQSQQREAEIVPFNALDHHPLPVDAPQYFYQTSPTSSNEADDQYNNFRLLCIAKEQKIGQLQTLCEEYRTKYETETQVLRHELDLSERKNDCRSVVPVSFVHSIGRRQM